MYIIYTYNIYIYYMYMVIYLKHFHPGLSEESRVPTALTCEFEYCRKI